MKEIEGQIRACKEALITDIPLGGLLSRNPVAYKWKTPFFVWVLREAVFWRIHDLMSQSCELCRSGHMLGARILLRSSFETLAILIYLNQLIEKVLGGCLDFHSFGEKVAALSIGTRNNELMPTALNILSVLEKCDKRYPGLLKVYGDLSESAHPNYEGLLKGYSKFNYEEPEAHFSNRWLESYGGQHPSLMAMCLDCFVYEYNDVWPALMEKLEVWIEQNDSTLQASS